MAIVKDGAAGPPIPDRTPHPGNVRRNSRLCGSSPLRLELPKDQVKGTVFEGQGGIKLGTRLPERRHLPAIRPQGVPGQPPAHTR